MLQVVTQLKKNDIPPNTFLLKNFPFFSRCIADGTSSNHVINNPSTNLKKHHDKILTNHHASTIPVFHNHNYNHLARRLVVVDENDPTRRCRNRQMSRMQTTHCSDCSLTDSRTTDMFTTAHDRCNLLRYRSQRCVQKTQHANRRLPRP